MVRIYTTQYGFFWKFTPDQFIAMCEEGIRTGQIDNDDWGRFLKGTPLGIRKSRESRCNPHWVSDPDVLLYYTLDAEKSDFEAAMKEVRDMIAAERIKKRRE